MKKSALIAAAVITILTVQSCRQSDDVMSPEEMATLQKVQDSSNNLSDKNGTNALEIEQPTPPVSEVDGEIAPPPRK